MIRTGETGRPISYCGHVSKKKFRKFMEILPKFLKFFHFLKDLRMKSKNFENLQKKSKFSRGHFPIFSEFTMKKIFLARYRMEYRCIT